MRATRAIIHLENLQSNLREIRKQTGPSTKMCVPVKANAYGHGAFRVAACALGSGATHLAVASVQEGIDLREAGIVAPILLFSLPIPEEIPSIIQNDLTPLASDVEFIEELASAAGSVNRICQVHLKIDSGMGRIGCTCEQAPVLAKKIAHNKHLELAGVATHLAVSDSLAAGDIEFTRDQINRFSKAVAAIRAEGIDPGIVHAANSGAVIMYPEAHFDMIRPGIIVYGYSPSPDLADKMPLKPVMELETQIVSIKEVAPGTSISYGRIWTAQESTYIATIPIGYADGLMRKLSPGLTVRIGDGNFPVVGRICMDQCMVDVGKDPWAQKWDKVTIFGPPPSGGTTAVNGDFNTAQNTAQTLADALGTIPYEITCDINARVPRVYVDSGKADTE
jgi:alanine racemase